MAAEIALDISMTVETQHKSMEMAVSKRRKYMVMEIEKSSTPPPVYEGPYNAVPRLYVGEILETKGKQMTDNVTIEPIPIWEVSNPQGGKTVTIGSV